MTLFTGLFIGIYKLFEGIKILFEDRKYWKYAALSFIINSIFYIIIFFILFHYLIPYLDNFFIVAHGGLLGSIIFFIKWIVNILIAIFFVFISVLFFNSIFIVITSPYLDGLSMLIEKERFSFKPLKRGLKDNIKGVQISIWNGIWLNLLTIFWAIVLFPLNFMIPVIGFLPGMLVSSYLFGLSFLMYSAEHRLLTKRELKALLKGRRSSILGLGLALYIILFIPFAAAIFIPAAVIGGTLLFNEYLIDEKDK